jgi:hypothetical protein
MQDRDDAKELIEYRTEPSREAKAVGTGILVRARSNTTGKFGNFDIAELNSDSLLRWLRSSGGKNLWAENTVALILGHQEWNWGEEQEQEKIEAENKYFREAFKYIENNVGLGGKTIKLLCKAILAGRIGTGQLDLDELDRIKEGK